MPESGSPRRDAVAAHARRVAGGQHGQASLELVALLPLVVVVAALIWQLAVAGHATWAAGAAARAAARADAVGDDAVQAARRAVPVELRRGLRLTEGGDGTVRVHLEIPSVAPGLDFGRATAQAHFPTQDA